jgi:hypothetical protein
MVQSKLIWFAGFLEGRGFYLQRDNHINLNGERGVWRICIKAGNAKCAEAFKKVSLILNRPIAKYGFSPSFGEAFEHQNRPAVFTDGRNVTYCITISCGIAQKLIKKIKPYLTDETLERLEPITTYKLATYQRCMATGQYRGKYRSPERRLAAKRKSGREYMRRKRKILGRAA